MGNLYRDGDSMMRHLAGIEWASNYRSANRLAKRAAEEHGLDAVQQEYVWGLWVVARAFGREELPADYAEHIQKKVRGAIEAGRNRPGGHGLPDEETARFPFEFDR